jgi:aspartyl/asparaginyl beta-hydroxylase (cupin superfamily)
LKILPPGAEIPPSLKSAVDAARITVAEQMSEFDDFLERRFAPIRKSHAGAEFDRLEECKAVAVGRTRAFVHEPTMLNVPQLPAIQYFDDALFPWLSELEAATDLISEELRAVLESEARHDLQPYVQYPPGVPVNQWVELNHSPNWSVYYLWENGEQHEAHCHACPGTAAVLSKVPLAISPGFAPTAFFSVLAPGAHIPPHTGSTNARSIVHLPLIVPGQCSFRVGNTTREWQRGKAWVFDDSIEHEAWNRSNKTRVILIFDVWNPFLTAAEKDLVNAFLIAQRDFYSGAQS